jgi:hypothetical protein
MKTECNCDLPYYAYKDWLQEQGWSVEDIYDEETAEFVIGFGADASYDSRDGAYSFYSAGFRFSPLGAQPYYCNSEIDIDGDWWWFYTEVGTGNEIGDGGGDWEEGYQHEYDD